MRFMISIAGTDHDVDLSRSKDAWDCRIDGRTVDIDLAVISPSAISILRHGKSYVVRQGPNGTVVVGDRDYEIAIVDPRSWRSRRSVLAAAAGPQKLTASMPGKVVRVLSAPGEHVKAGQGILVMEAMKMQNELRSPRDGTITSILVQEGSAVNAGQVVAIVE